MIDHMKDFLVYSQTRSPVFIYNPALTAPEGEDAQPDKVIKLFQRFKECLAAGQLEQA